MDAVEKIVSRVTRIDGRNQGSLYMVEIEPGFVFAVGKADDERLRERNLPLIEPGDELELTIREFDVESKYYDDYGLPVLEVKRDGIILIDRR